MYSNQDKVIIIYKDDFYLGNLYMKKYLYLFLRLDFRNRNKTIYKRGSHTSAKTYHDLFASELCYVKKRIFAFNSGIYIEFDSYNL